MSEEKKESLWKRISKKIPSPVKKFLTGAALFITSQTAYSAPTANPNAEKDLQVLDPIETFEHYKNNASPIGIITYFETHGSGTNGLLPPAATKNSSGKYFGLIQMSHDVRKMYYKTLKECAEMSNEEFAQKYCLTEICNDEQISYLKNGCATLVSEIGDRNASNVYAHQRAAKKYPYFSAVTQELFDCADFYAPAIKDINKKIASEGIDFKFEQLHPAIQFASFRILALGQNKYAPIIGKSISNYIKNDSNAINYITAKEINEQMKEGLLKDILKPRPKVINIIDSLENKPLEYWMASAHLYNAVNGGTSDSSWFAQRDREIHHEEMMSHLQEELKSTQIHLCEPYSLTVNDLSIQQQMNTLHEKIFERKQGKKKPTIADSKFTINGEEGLKYAHVYNQSGKRLTGRKAKKQLKRAKELAELAKNPAYQQAIQKAFADRNVQNKA